MCIRDSYEFLGLKVGVVESRQDSEAKRAAYQADITYGTNNEFGFDYLRDNMAFSIEERYQRGLNFAIVDEVDSILIDEARTPLIISGQAEDSSRLYKRINQFIPSLTPVPEDDSTGEGHYTIDEKSRQVELTEAGHELVEELILETTRFNFGQKLQRLHLRAGVDGGFTHHDLVEFPHAPDLPPEVEQI